MLSKTIVWLVSASRRFAFVVIALALAASVMMGIYVADHIKINTDINQLLSANLGWRQQEQALEKAFPQTVDRLVVVVDGDTPDLAEDAATTLTEAMQNKPELFKNTYRPDNIPFFRKNGLLFMDKNFIGDMLDMMVQGQPLLGSIAADPSLRGLFNTLNLVLMGLQQNQFEYEKIDQPLMKFSDTIESVLAGQDKPLPFRSMVSDKQPTLRDIRKVILTQPVLDYEALSPGEKASAAIRQIAAENKLTAEHGVHVRLTGSVALNDEEFASVADGATTATILSITSVLVILFLALRSARLILPILLTLTAGLIATTAFAMATIGSLNLISVAFAVMFVGIAVDFGIQFGVRYRDQRHQEPDNAKAMQATAHVIALPIAMAAGSTALGFMTFIPTDYSGVAELGLIAGAGMIIAFILNITLLPALLTLAHPAPEPEAVGFAWAAPIDAFLLRHRGKVLLATAMLAIGATFIAAQLTFDFDPLDLKDPKAESVATMFDLMRDPDANIYTVDILAKDLTTAKEVASKIEKLPEVDHIITLASFVPEEQEQKLAMIGDANFLLAPTLNPAEVASAPSDDEVVETIEKTVKALNELTPAHPATTKLAQTLSGVIDRRNHDMLQRLHDSLLKGLIGQLAQVRDILSVQPVSVDSITDDLRKDWVAADGRAKIEVYPKGNPHDHKVLAAFTDAVRQIAPEASGTAISIQESGKTITGAFTTAGIAAIIAIALLVFAVLRRPMDVVRLLTPLFLAGILTLATMQLIGIPLNFANIIALPLLLSLGVSYAIYFISYWRTGLTNPLQSSMARAVLFSAATTLVAFGSLSISAHPGTSSMGELLTIALLYCVLCTFLLLPALLGEPKVD